MFFCRRRLSPPPPHRLTRNVKIKLGDIPPNQSHISRRPISAVSPIRSIEKTHRHVRPGATLWTKHPLHGQAMFALDRLGRCHRSTLGGKEKDPFNSVLRVTEKGTGTFTESDWLEIVAVTHAWTRRKSFRHSSNNGSRRQSSTAQSSIHRVRLSAHAGRDWDISAKTAQKRQQTAHGSQNYLYSPPSQKADRVGLGVPPYVSGPNARG